MILQLTKVEPQGSKFSGEDPIETLGWEGAETDIIRPASPLRWRFTAKLFDTELLITGEASADFTGICARCGSPANLTIREPLSFSVQVEENAAEVDLTDEIRDAVLLSLPLNPLCKPDCAGLCPRCGRSLEDGDCNCAPPDDAPDTTNPFSALDKLGGV